MNVLIVEDDCILANSISNQLKELGKYKSINIENNLSDAKKSIDIANPDVIVMDIYLKGAGTGLDLANMIMEREIPIVFISQFGKEEDYVEAQRIPYHAFIVKPFHILTLDCAIDNLLAMKHIGTNIFGIVYRSGSTRQLIPFKNIVYVEADRNYCVVCTDDSRFSFRSSMSKIFEKLNNDAFIQIHKSYIINASKIQSVDFNRGEVYIKNRALPIGQHYRHNLMSFLSTF